MMDLKRYENLEKLLDEISQDKLPDIVLQLLSEGKQLQKSYVLEAIEVCARRGEFKKAGKIAELDENYPIAYKMYLKAGKKEDAERVRRLIYGSF